MQYNSEVWEVIQILCCRDNDASYVFSIQHCIAAQSMYICAKDYFPLGIGLRQGCGLSAVPMYLAGILVIRFWICEDRTQQGAFHKHCDEMVNYGVRSACVMKFEGTERAWCRMWGCQGQAEIEALQERDVLTSLELVRRRKARIQRLLSLYKVHHSSVCICSWFCWWHDDLKHEFVIQKDWPTSACMRTCFCDQRFLFSRSDVVLLSDFEWREHCKCGTRLDATILRLLFVAPSIFTRDATICALIWNHLRCVVHRSYTTKRSRLSSCIHFQWLLGITRQMP